MDFLHFFKFKKLSWAALALAIITFLFIASCRDDKITPDVPVVVTGEITDIGPDGATFHGSIINRGNGSVTEVGFVWDTVHTPGLNSSRKVVTYEEGTTAFHAQVVADHQAGKEYSIKAYLKNGEQIFLGNSVKFTSMGSLPPEITDFSPKSGLRNTEVTIYGKNFSYVPSHINVMFGYIAVTVTASTDSTITVKIPQNVYTSGIVKITVSVLGKSKVSDKSFEIGGVFIESFSPKSTGCGGVVKIKGKNFKMGQWTYVYFRHMYNSLEYHQAEIIALTDTSISTKVPVRKNGIQDVYKIEVHSDRYVGVAIDEFRIINPKINSVSKSIIMPYDTLVILGDFAGKVMYLILGDFWMDNFTQKDSEITLVYEPVLAEGSYELKLVNECYHTAVFSEKITVKSQWTVLNNIPVSPRIYPVCLPVGDKLYIGLGNDMCTTPTDYLNDWWEFNTISEQWTRKADFPGEARNYQMVSVHENQIIMLGGQNEEGQPLGDFWRYNPTTNEWKELSPYPPGPRFDGVIYSIQDKIYAGLGKENWYSPYLVFTL